MYKIKNTSITNLIAKGFKPICLDGFCLHFPVYWYNKKPLIFCNAIIYPDESKEIRIDVLSSSGAPYFHWYIKNYKQAGEILEKIDNEIHKKMCKIGVRYYKDK